MSISGTNKRLSRRTRAVFDRLNKEFPCGFLPEEASRPRNGTPAGKAGLEAVRWPWAADRGSLSRELLSDVHNELLCTELAIAEAIVNDKLVVLAEEMAASLESWINEQITAEGLLLPDPWRTYAILPSLYRLRIALEDIAWSESCEACFQRIAEATLRTAWWKGWLFAEESAPSVEFRNLLASAVSGANIRKWAAARKMLWEKEKVGKNNPPVDCGFQSDDAQIGVLRRDWTVGGPVIGVDYRASEILLNARIFGEAVFAGTWETVIRIDGKEVPCDSEWAATCWFSDTDGEYIELQTTLADDVIIDRQIFLARNVALIWMSDTLRTPAPGKLELGWRLPTRPDVHLKGELPTRAQKMKGHKFDLRFIPAGLPAEPLAGSDGRFAMTVDGLAVDAVGETDRLFLPAAFTWSARSLPAASGWRALSITNDRRPVRPDEAVAFRVPVADTQIVFFRALKQPKRYAFVGHQTYSECEIGEVDRDGTFSEWLTIEEDKAEK